MENAFAPRFDRRDEPHPRQVAFEDERVHIVLDRFGLSAHISELMRRFEEKWGRKWLTFESFFEFFPTFPVLLEAHSFYHVAQHCRPADLFRSFDRLFLLQRYLDVFARGREDAGARPIGMAFPFDGYLGGMIMHNGHFDTGGTKMVHDLANDAPPHRVVVEPFIAFVNFLAKSGWTPQRTRPTGRATQKPRTSLGVRVSPWMVQLFGCGPDLLVLAFLRRVLRSPSGQYRELICVQEGIRHVRIDQNDLAIETGLTRRQVKRAIIDLRAGGYISTKSQRDRGRVKTCFRLHRDVLRLGRDQVLEADLR